MPKKSKAINVSDLNVKLNPKFGRYKVSAKPERTYGDRTFDSKWEMETFKLLETHLPKDYNIYSQVEFPLQPKFKNKDGKAVREINYISDFLLTRSNPCPVIKNETDIPADAVVIDSKGHITDIFKLKNKMFMFKYNNVIKQVKRPADVMDIINTLQ